MNSYERFCFNLLGKRMKRKREDSAQLRNDIISARFKTPIEVYLSTAFVSSIIVGLAAAAVIGAISWILKLPALIKFNGAVPGSKKNELKPHLSKYWKIPPEGSAAFVAAMEDVLEVYHLPYDPDYPVVCMDESCKQMIGEVREPIPCEPGQPERID